jgi:hypothetical protein
MKIVIYYNKLYLLQVSSMEGPMKNLGIKEREKHSFCLVVERLRVILTCAFPSLCSQFLHWTLHQNYGKRRRAGTEKCMEVI